MLVARDLQHHFGKRALLDKISLSLLPGERVALVGQNGMGKSTLLQILAGLLEPDSGSVDLAAGATLGVLMQMPNLNPTQTIEQAIGQGHEKYRVEKVLSKLGVRSKTDPIGTLSGGELRRVDLARLLLAEPSIYLLDEPTNHLDVAGIQFLAETLVSSNRPVLFISHDRAFVDEVATRILELDDGRLYGHDTPFANYIENRLIRTDINQRSAHRRERLMAQELVWLRAGTPARTTKQNARIDRAEELINQVTKDTVANAEKKAEILAAKSKRLGKTILELEDVSFTRGERTLFSHVNLKVVSGERFGILGPNGCGKTTLISVISGKLAPTTGRVIVGPHTQFGFFDQNRQILDPESTLKQTLADHGDYVFAGEERIHIASYLERFLFDAGDMYRKVVTLSGGEQNRLLLAKLFKQGANCLMMDEPTNDLDVTTLAVLEEALLNHDGVAFVVSHDRKFLDRVCTGIIAFEPNVVVYQGNYTTYQRLKADKPAPASPKAEAKAKEDKRPQREKRRGFNEEREYKTIEAQIEKAEKERDQLHSDLADGSLFKSDPQLAQEKTKSLEVLDSQIEKLYQRWQELEDLGD